MKPKLLINIGILTSLVFVLAGCGGDANVATSLEEHTKLVCKNTIKAQEEYFDEAIKSTSGERKDLLKSQRKQFDDYPKDNLCNCMADLSDKTLKYGTLYSEQYGNINGVIVGYIREGALDRTYESMKKYSLSESMHASTYQFIGSGLESFYRYCAEGINTKNLFYRQVKDGIETSAQVPD